jgi:DNA-binding transcriptional LysR family regulator
MGVTQPTVARRIDELEHELGLLLFERDTRGFHPTADAEKLVAAAEAVEATVREFGDASAALSDDTSKAIRFSAPTAAVSDKLYEIIAEFKERFPDTPVDVIPSNKFVDLWNGDADISLRITPMIKDEKLISRKLGVLKGGIYASTDYAASLPKNDDQLRGHKFAAFEGSNIPQTLNDWLLDRIEPTDVAVTCSDLGSMVATIAKGGVLGPLPRPVGKKAAKLVKCFDVPDSLFVPVWLVMPPSAHRRKSVKSFVKFLAQNFSRLGW